MFRKSVEKIQVSVKSDKNNCYITRTPNFMSLYLSKSLLEWETFRTKIFREIQNTQIWSDFDRTSSL